MHLVVIPSQFDPKRVSGIGVGTLEFTAEFVEVIRSDDNLSIGDAHELAGGRRPADLASLRR